MMVGCDALLRITDSGTVGDDLQGDGAGVHIFQAERSEITQLGMELGRERRLELGHVGSFSDRWREVVVFESDGGIHACCRSGDE